MLIRFTFKRYTGLASEGGRAFESRRTHQIQIGISPLFRRGLFFALRG